MKASDIRDSYNDHLPKPPRVTFGNIFFGVAGCASIAGLLLALWTLDQSVSEMLFSVFLILLSLSCLTYTAIQAHKRLHRYAEAVYFYHYVNHTLRDYTAQVVLHEGPDRSLDDLLADVLTAVSTCFWMVTGKQCRCCLKEITDPVSQEIVTTRRDRHSEAQGESRVIASADDVDHTLEGNTDFYQLWYALDRCKRVYLANNLLEDYRCGRYGNTSFEVLGHPQILSRWGFTYVRNWTLPYRSAMVLPIRYVSEFKPPLMDSGQDTNPHWNYWGFLCVDCNSRNVFDDRYAVELGGAFADLLYSLFQELDLAKHAQLDNS